MKKSTWKLDKWWCVKSVEHYFRISDVLFFVKSEKTFIFIAFTGHRLDIGFNSELERDKMFKWFCDAKSGYLDAVLKTKKEYGVSLNKLCNIMTKALRVK